MSNATDTVRSTRADARAFAEAFSDVDDAFSFTGGASESRELSLDELGDVLGLGGGGPATTAPRAAPRGPRADSDARPRGNEDELLTLDELGDALARGERTTDDLDFDFGTSANERARRRTAARLGSPEPEPRRTPGARPTTASSAGRTVMLGSHGLAAASAATAARMAAPSTVSGRPVPAPARLREIEPPARPPKAFAERFGGNPDRIAMWAVLLGIVLILIAFTSGSAGAVALPLISAL